MKRMKKKIIIGLASCTMLAAVAAFINSNNSNTMSAMALANVQALTDFEFNGQNWNETDTHGGIGSHWLPKEIECTRTVGESTYWGKMVACDYGNGNCYNGTPCR